MKIRLRGISTQFITNPLSVYALGFVAVLMCYSLRWSSFYADIGLPLLVFIIVSSFISWSCACLINDKNLFRPIAKDPHNKKFMLFIFGGLFLDFVYCRSIPFVSVVLGGIGGYRDFEGIPMFHVIWANILYFLSIYIFHQYQSNLQNKTLRRYVLLTYVPHILLLNRGGLILVLLSSLIIYWMRIGRISLRKILISLLGVLAFFFLFGVMGNSRSDISQDDKEYILRIGGATPEFIASNVPEEFYWAYLYIASPLGNLQNIMESTSPEPSSEGLCALVMTQWTPDWLSKRLEHFLPYSYDGESYLVTPTLNAPTAYYMPYMILGWMGVVLTFLFMIVVVFVYQRILSVHSVYYLTGWSWITAVIMLNTFNNMWYFGGLTVIFIVFVASGLRGISRRRYMKRLKY